MENKNDEKINISKSSASFNNLFKEEWLSKDYDSYSISSINNGINPIINILIDSIDRFSFGELLEDEKQNDLIKKNGPDNYLILNNKQNNEQETNLIENIDEIIYYNNNAKDLDKEKVDIKNKICGVFTKEDFDINIKNEHKSKISDSFDKKYNNPLANNLLVNSKEKNIINENEILENTLKNNDNLKEDENLKQYQELINSKTDKEINLDNLDNIKEAFIDKKDIDNKKINESIIKYENPKIKSEDVYCRDNNIIDDSLKEKDNEKIINIPLSQKKEEKNNSSVISFNKLMDIDVKEKLIELSEKVEKNEKNFEKIEKKNEKLLDIINIFKNFKFFDKKQISKSRENTIQSSTKRISIKKRCYSPSFNNYNLKKISNNKEKINTKEKINIKSKKNKSFSKNVFIDTNSLFNDNNYLDYKKIKEYCLSKRSTYSQIYAKDKNYKKNSVKSKLYKKVKTKNNRPPSTRRTLFLTGKNYSKKINNYTNSNKIITFSRDNDKVANENYLYNFSFPSTRKNQNQNNSEILFSNGIGNIFQREIMKLPPEQQPLFYESNKNFFKDKFLYDKNTNNCNDTISFKKSKINFEEKYNYKTKVFNKFIENKNNGINNYLNIYTNGNQNLSFNNNINYQECKSSRYNKNKFLNFKDFQVIFEEKNRDINNKKSHINNENQIPSSKGKINNNTKLNSENNYIKENGNVIKENGNPKGYINYSNNNKYSDFINKKYRNLFGKQVKSNVHSINNNNEELMNKNTINDQNKNEFTLPFYLINRQEFFMNILNSSNTNKKCIQLKK